MAIAVVAVTAVGCGTQQADGDDTRESKAGEDVTYDLTTPPTRADAGMADGEKVAIDETDEGRLVSLGLPGDRTLETEVSLVTFDSYAAGVDADTADPTGMDMHTPRMDLSAATTVLSESLRQLGGAVKIAEDWRRAAEQAQGTETVRSENTPLEIGYLTARVQGRYSPIDQKASISYTLYWG
ncbi:MAG TPA: hypothetical protein VEX15_21520 [Nocardioidaceae bacterium]|nr:hypothetical protein [Nocardioidaceae bacterium]